MAFIAEYINMGLQVIITYATDNLLPFMVLVFLLGATLRAVIYFTIHCEAAFALEFEKRVHKYLADPNYEHRYKSFHALTRRLLERTYEEHYELRKKLRRRRMDQLMTITDRIFMIPEGARRLIADTLSQTKYLHKGGREPKFVDISRWVFESNPVFNRVVGLLPIAIFHDILNILPGLFVIGGIFGTFLGVMQALPMLSEMDITNVESTKAIMDSFLLKMAFAMGTSVVGIILSVSMTMFNALLNPDGTYYSMVNKFTSALDFLWNDTSTNDVADGDHEGLAADRRRVAYSSGRDRSRARELETLPSDKELEILRAEDSTVGEVPGDRELEAMETAQPWGEQEGDPLEKTAVFEVPPEPEPLYEKDNVEAMEAAMMTPAPDGPKGTHSNASPSLEKAQTEEQMILAGTPRAEETDYSDPTESELAADFEEAEQETVLSSSGEEQQEEVLSFSGERQEEETTAFFEEAQPEQAASPVGDPTQAGLASDPSDLVESVEAEWIEAETGETPVEASEHEPSQPSKTVQDEEGNPFVASGGAESAAVPIPELPESAVASEPAAGETASALWDEGESVTDAEEMPDAAGELEQVYSKVDEVLAGIEAVDAEKEQEVEARIEVLRHRVGVLDEYLERADADRLTGKMSEEMWREETEKYASEKEQIQQEIEDLEDEDKAA